MIADINELIEKISKFSNFSKEEIRKRIEAKREKLGRLISLEGAAQIVAAELGVKFENITLNISDLLPGMKRINVIGKIIDNYGVRFYKRGDKQLKVATFLLADSTDAIRVVLWDTNHIDLIEKNEIKLGDIVEINNAYVRGDIDNKELHLTNNSIIKLSENKIENIVDEYKYKYKLIDKLTTNVRAKIRAFVVQIFTPKIFDMCPICNSKSCIKHEEREKRILFPFIVDDGSGNIRCVAFKETTLKMLNVNNIDEINEEKLKNLIGEEFWFDGRVRKNKKRDEIEFVVNDVERVDIKQLIEKLQNL
ncbi:MAG: DUF2240 family protein [Candidatus Pacearchaeota archaeon]